MTDGRIAGEDEKIGEINPNTWDTVTRIYLCRKEEFSFSRSRCMLSVHHHIIHINPFRRIICKRFLGDGTAAA